MECAPGRCSTLRGGARHCRNSAIQTKTFPATEVQQSVLRVEALHIGGTCCGHPRIDPNTQEKGQGGRSALVPRSLAFSRML